MQNILLHEAGQNAIAAEGRGLMHQTGKFVQAQKLTPSQHEDTTWLHVDSLEEGYFHNIGELYEHYLVCLSNGAYTLADLPQFCWACKPLSINTPDALTIAEQAIEEAYDDAIDDIDPQSLTNLQLALDAFSAANQHIISWEPDHDRAILLDWSWLPTYLSPELLTELLECGA